ncbi:MAG: Arc family DNA-binding protein [Agitococcus sp.]|nr:Arc family DNA-binding protein [Agitococcus sp.]
MVSADIQFNLRVPVKLKEKVAESAKASGRSINAEALVRLEKSFDSNLQASVHKPRRRIMLGTWNCGNEEGRSTMIEKCWKYLEDFFDRYSDYELINVETQEHGIIFWYSYPAKESDL